MLDEIVYKTTCHQCGEPLREFQSKSGDNVLARLTPQQLYAIAKANSWEEFVIKPGAFRKLRIIPVKNQERSLTKNIV